MPAKRKSPPKKILVKDNSSFLLFALLLVAALFLLIAFGPFKADKLGLLGKKQQTQQSEAAVLPPDSGGGVRRGPCKFLPKNTATAYPYGDVNRDGWVSSVDAQMVLNTVVLGPMQSPPPGIAWGYGIEAGDVNDKEIALSNRYDLDSADALLILNYVAFKTNTFPACFGHTADGEPVKLP